MLKVFKNLTKKEWLLIGISILFIVMQVWLELTMPDYMSDITTLVQTAGSTMGEVLTAGGKMLLCALGSLIASVLTSICASKIASNFSAILRGKLFHKVQTFSMEEIGNFSTASLITRSTNDINQVQLLIVMGLQVLIKAPITAVWAICKISGKNSEWTISTGIAVICLLVVLSICLFIAVPKFKQVQTLTDNLNRVTRENLTGLRVVRAYNAEEYQENKFKKVNQDLTSTNLFTARTMSFVMPSIQLIMSSLSLSIYWIGAILINNSADMVNKTALFSDMIVFSQYAIQIIMSFMMLVIIFIIFPRASVAADRINEVLYTETKIKDGTIENNDTNIKGQVEFKNVSFRYPDAEEDVITNITFKANKGETVAFIGSTGSGKSTIINLVPRFYDVTQGEVLVDGINVKEYTQKALRNKIGYVSQKSILFTGTISSNVAYGDNGRDDLNNYVENSIRISQAEEFVSKLTDKYNSYVAQNGSNFSGGQKQRISIARAICRQPEILIFDDSFSALDYKTDRILRDALDKYCKGTTKLIVAQRIGTIMGADRIIVLDDGQIVGNGTHKELMSNCNVYQQIAYSQLSKEELE